MGLYFFGMALLASVFIMQGVYILKSGTIVWFFVHRVREEKAPTTLPPLATRLSIAAVYLASGFAVLILLAEMMAHCHVTLALVGAHLRQDYLGLLIAAGLEAGGIWSVIRPSGMVAQIGQAHPELQANDPAVLRIVRLIGIGLCAGGTVLLVAFLFGAMQGNP
jgi:hypothetical protein